MPALTVFNENNRVIGPANVLIARTALGFTEEGVDYQPSVTKDEFPADQVSMNIGSVVTKLGGKLSMKLLECTEANFLMAFDIPAGVSISSPIAGDRYDMKPNETLTKRQIEWYGRWSAGRVIHNVIAGEIAKLPPFPMNSTKKTTLDLEFDQIKLNTAYPMGFTHIYDAVSGAVTATTTPADDATGVDDAASISIQFNKPMSVMALMAEHFLFTKDSDSSAVAFTPAFATTTVSGITIVDPTKIILTPDSALTASAAYTLKIYQAIPAVDGTVMAADVTTNFTVAAS